MRLSSTSLCVLLVFACCGGDAVGPELDASVPPGSDATVSSDAGVFAPVDLWPSGDAPLEWTDWVAERPWLTDVSSWSFGGDVVEGPLAHRHLPDFGVGNGHVFALVGYGRPINTLHSMVGPTYDKGEGFFGDVAVEIRGPSGQVMDWDQEWAGWVRGAPVVHTQATNDTLNLSTVDFAPLDLDGEGPVLPTFWRFVIVKNRSEQILDSLDLVVTCAREQEAPSVDAMVERRGERSRLTYALQEPGARVVDGELIVSVGTLEPGAERVVTLVFAHGDGGDPSPPWITSEIAAMLLEETIEAWHARTADATVIDTPDERVDDYLEGQRTIILSQQAHTGSSQPMCEYTGAWLRDQAGPVRYLLRSGMAESAREMLDYLWLATLAHGDISNTYLGGYQPEEAQPEPDWASMPVMDGRERAESPSYVPLMHRWYWRATGQGDLFAERSAWMSACLDRQDFRGDLLPFSTDETFRTAMASAHGLSVLEQFEFDYLSANSSFLWVAAAEGMAEMASEILGAEGAELAAHYTERAAAVRAAAEETFLSEAGHYHPYVTEDSGEPAVAPFEDVNTKPIWSGYVSPDAPAATDQLAAVISALGGEDGVLVSPLPEDFEPVLDHPMEDGVYTGMSPGYYLSNLAQTHHPLAAEAFDALALHATPSGATAEYHILDDFGPLHPIYDPVGSVGDYTARFRPWEGGILAEAAYAYLLGNVCDAVAGTLTLAPNLPNDWPWLEARRVRCGEARLDLRVDATEVSWSVTLTHREGPDLEVHLALPLVGPATVAGQPWDAESETLAWGNQLLRLAPLTLGEGAAQEVRAAR